MASINLQNVQIKNGSTWYKMCPFPVGFIYLSQNSTSPATTFGGTWAALNEDRFLRPSAAWTTGGSKKILINQIPSHAHTADMCWIENTGSQTITRGKFVYRDSGKTTAQPVWNTSYVGGGARLLAPISRLLRLVSYSLDLGKWVI